MAIAKWYPAAIVAAFNKEIDIVDDSIYAALVTSSYTPADTHDFWNDVVANEVANGNGYTTNGVALASKGFAFTAANSWGASWAAATAYKAGTLVRPTTGNGYVYRAQGDGTSAGSEPTWPTTVGDEVTDNGVTWTNYGRGVIAYTFTDPAWTSLTKDFRYVVFVNRTPASDATRHVLGYIDMGAQSLTATNLTIDVPSTGLLTFPLI